MTTRLIFLCIAIALILPAPLSGQEGQRFYVAAANQGGGLQDGVSWATAFGNLQQALAIAQAGDTVWVAQGLYLPTTTSNREVSFFINSGVALLGGFEGNELYAHQRNDSLYPTILSGDIGASGDTTDNSYHVVYMLDADSATVLDGFIIERGHARKEGDYGPANHGGGLFIDAGMAGFISSPLIKNCTFRKNAAAMPGGAIYAAKQESNAVALPHIEDCHFYDNTSWQSGGAINLNSRDNPDSPQTTILRCEFHNNYAHFDGGAVHYYDMVGEHIIDSSSFTDNYAFIEGGAIYSHILQNGGKLSLLNCYLSKNHARLVGGGFSYNHWGTSSIDTFELSCSKVIFSENIARIGEGGAIMLTSSGNHTLLNIYDCEFIANQSGVGSIGMINSFEGSHIVANIHNSRFIGNKSITDLGAAIYAYGTIFSSGNMTNNILISNCVFYNNEGVLALFPGHPGTLDTYVINCTFLNNGAVPILKGWSSSFDYITFYDNMTFINSIIWEELADPNYVFFNNQETFHLYDFYINHCLIIDQQICALPGGTTACGAGNIFDQYPMFLDTANLDFRLAACSPALDAGDNAIPVIFGLSTDLAGQARIQQGTVDLGAYERPASWQNSVAEIIPPVCPDSRDGVIIINSTGDEPLAFAWSQGSQNGTGNTELAAGNYQFTITDAAGCVDTLSVTIQAPAPFALQFAIEQASGPQTPNGSVSIQSADGGAPPYHWLWSTGDTTANITNLLPGLYSLTLTDANACEAVFDTVVGFVTNTQNPVETGRALSLLQPNPVRSGSSVTLYYHQAKPSKSGALRLSDSAGRLMWQQSWQPGNESGQVEIPITGLPAGVYFLNLQTEGKTVAWRLAVLE